MSDDHTPTYRILTRRALAADDPALLPLHFEAAVLQRYLDAPGFSTIRTDTVGRVRKQGGWSLDFGVAPDESLVHVCWGDFVRLPAEERDHWAAHARALPSSHIYMQMRLAPGSCIDDGDVRNWE